MFVSFFFRIPTLVRRDVWMESEELERICHFFPIIISFPSAWNYYYCISGINLNRPRLKFTFIHEVFPLVSETSTKWNDLENYAVLFLHQP